MLPARTHSKFHFSDFFRIVFVYRTVKIVRDRWISRGKKSMCEGGGERDITPDHPTPPTHVTEGVPLSRRKKYAARILSRSIRVRRSRFIPVRPMYNLLLFNTRHLCRHAMEFLGHRFDKFQRVRRLFYFNASFALPFEWGRGSERESFN